MRCFYFSYHYKLPFDVYAYTFDMCTKSLLTYLRGPRRDTVPYVRRKVPIGYNGTPQIRPKSTPSRAPIPKPRYLPHPWTRPTYDAKRHPDRIRSFSTMHWTDQRTDAWTHRPTDRPRESLIPIGRCAGLKMVVIKCFLSKWLVAKIELLYNDRNHCHNEVLLQMHRPVPTGLA